MSLARRDMHLAVRDMLLTQLDMHLELRDMLADARAILSLPFWGRWIAVGKTDEVIEILLFSVQSS